MIASEKKKTLLVIGAGASVDFSLSTQPESKNSEDFLQNEICFPSGAELIERLQMLPDIAYEYARTNNVFEYYPSPLYYWKFNLEIDKSFENKACKTPEEAKKLLMVRLKNIRKIQNIMMCDLTHKETNQRVMWFYGNNKINSMQLQWDNNFLLDSLLTELLLDYKPQSIDYYIGKDAIHHISAEHIQKMKEFDIIPKEIVLTEEQEAERKAFNNVDNERFILWLKLKERAKEKIKEILGKCKIQNIGKSYFYNILCNHVGIDNIDNLEIITFNYDIILEKTLDYLIENNHSEERKKKLENLKSRIKHVYGDTEKGIDFIRNVEKDKTEDYSKFFAKADNIYFLGFAFDDQNLKNLGLKSSLPVLGELDFRRGRKVFITNFGAFSNIEFRIAKLFHCKFEFVRNGTRQGFFNSIYGGENYIYIAEKTITESLKRDFFFE
jgi:hypothetical protein